MAAVARPEISPERAVHLIAEPAAGLRRQQRLGQVAQVSGHGQSNIGQAEFDELALSGQMTMAVGGEDGERGEKAGHRVPGRQHVIDRCLVAFGPGDPRKAKGRIDRIVDRRAAVPVSGDDDHDRVATHLRELLI